MTCMKHSGNVKMKDNLFEEEITRLKQWVHDLQSGMYINCVYCGHRYGPVLTTPMTKADILKEHISQCPEHPMSRLVGEIKKLEAECAKAMATESEFNCPINDGLFGCNAAEVYPVLCHLYRVATGKEPGDPYERFGD